MQKAASDQQAVSGDKAVGPVIPVLIELDGILHGAGSACCLLKGDMLPLIKLMSRASLIFGTRVKNMPFGQLAMYGVAPNDPGQENSIGSSNVWKNG